MNIICDKTLLSAAIDGVSKAVTLRSTIPVLEGILLKAEGFQLTLTGYDLEMGIVTTIEANVKEAGDYTLFAAVSGEGGQLKFSLDGEDIGDILTVSKSNAEPSDEEVDESVYGDFFKVKTNVTLPAGTHILRMTVVKQWFDLDYFNFVKGKDAEDNAPVGTEAIAGNIHMAAHHLVQYDLIDIHGKRQGSISAYTMDQAIAITKNWNTVKSTGVYFLRSRATGKVHSLRIVK